MFVLDRHLHHLFSDHYYYPFLAHYRPSFALADLVVLGNHLIEQVEEEYIALSPEAVLIYRKWFDGWKRCKGGRETVRH